MWMALVTACALALACLGFGSVLLGLGDARARLRVDAVSGLTGLALLSTFAGAFVLAGAYSIGVAWGLMLLGIAGLARELARERRRPRLAPPSSASAVGVSAASRGLAGGIAASSFALIAATLLSGLQMVLYNGCDDWPIYLHLPRLMLETGSYIEPFSLRRMSALGPVQFLQSLFWNDLGVAAHGVSDMLVGQVLLWAAVRRLPALERPADRAPARWFGEGLALGALVLSLSHVVWNTTPVVLPAVATVVLLVMSRELLSRRDEPGALALAVGWGLVAAWLIGTRLNGAPFPALLWAIGGLAALVRRNAPEVRLVVAAGAGTGLGLLPWCLSLWQSSGTPLFPLIPGHFRVPDLNVADLDAAGVLLAIGEGLMDGRAWALLVCAALAAFASGHRGLSLSIATSILAMMAATTATSTGFERITTYRYSAPFAMGTLVYLAVVAASHATSALSRERAPSIRRRGAAVLVVLVATCVAWFVVPFEYPRGREATPRRHTNVETLISNVDLRKRALARTLETWSFARGFDVQVFGGGETYARAQSVLPPDARVLSATTRPFHFRFDQQTIHTLDLLGVVGPDPGWPIGEGAERLAGYFAGLGYTHLVFSPPNPRACLYSLRRWERHRQGLEAYLQKLAPRMLDVMQNSSRLARTRRNLFRHPNVVVLDLAGDRARERQGNP